MESRDSPIFVVGMPRSGTTLVSAMLAAHQNIAISPETHFISEWMSRYRNLDVRKIRDFQIFWDHFSKSICFKNLHIDHETTQRLILSSGDHDYKDIFSTILKLFAEKQGKRRWGEKTPTHYAHVDLLLEWCPQARIVYMIRDPRAVVASRLNMSWRYPLSWWYSRTVDDIASQWQTSIGILDNWSADHRVYAVQYEKLVQNPETELRTLCDFIGEEYLPSMLNYTEAARDLVGEEPWKEAALKQVTVESIDKWRSQLSLREITIIEYLTRKGMVRHQYRMIAEPPGFFLVFFLNSVKMVRGLKRRFFKRPFLCS